MHKNAPKRAARINGVSPSTVLNERLAPLSTSTFTTPWWPLEAVAWAKIHTMRRNFGCIQCKNTQSGKKQSLEITTKSTNMHSINYSCYAQPKHCLHNNKKERERPRQQLEQENNKANYHWLGKPKQEHDSKKHALPAKWRGLEPV